MQQGPSRTSAGRYWLWATLPAAVILIVLLITAISWFGMVGAVLILILTFMVCALIFKAWEKGQISFGARWTRAARDIPYYQPSRPPYTQGYQQQSSRRHATPGAAPKEEHPSEYEQPQAQYPEQMPPMA